MHVYLYTACSLKLCLIAEEQGIGEITQSIVVNSRPVLLSPAAVWCAPISLELLDLRSLLLHAHSNALYLLSNWKVMVKAAGVLILPSLTYM